MASVGDLLAEMDADRMKEAKAFDDAKAGVKGVVDAGIVSIPKIFIRSPEELAEDLKSRQIDMEVPVIDLTDVKKDSRRKEIVEEVRIASEKWGFFQVVNHGIPLSVLNGMIDGVRLFNEQDLEVKQLFYSRNRTRKVIFHSNYDLYKSSFANWRDTLLISAPDSLDPEELPAVCRKSTIEYTKHVKELGSTLFELLSEALGLKADHLKSLGCADAFNLVGHYYPPCPEPELTLGVSKHTDAGILTVLLQSQMCSLQVFYEGQWVNVHPIPGALVINIGDLLQLISNDKLKSVVHRVLARRDGSRISVPCFFSGGISVTTRTYSPIKELTSENNPPRYREVMLGEYVSRFLNRPLDGKSNIEFYKL